MFEKLGHSIARRSKAIFLLAITAVLVFGTLGTQVFSRFDSGATQTQIVTQRKFGST